LIRKLIAAALLASAAVSVQILATDTELWEAAPSHAYALIGFVALDLFLVAIIFRFPTAGFKLTTIWALAKFFVMLGDIFTGPSVGFQDYSQFVEYLFSLWNFDLLLVLQPLIAILGYQAFRTRKYAPSRSLQS